MRAKKHLILLGLVFLLATPHHARKIDMKINLAGNAVDGFSAEEEFLQLGEEAVKTRFHGNIKGGGNDLKVFQTQRFSRDEDLVIHIPVPDGVYSVTLMFAETWKGAFQAGKRVFDVYLGSKPGGVIKVAQNFDPFRAGGPAGPVRRKYDGIATQDGLTVALRPIKQNPQIAGIVVSGFSYSEALLDELPTIAADGSPAEDFSVLSTIGPRLPVDPSMIYDPSLNPKLREAAVAGVNRPSSATSSHNPNLLTGRTSAYAPQNHVSAPGHGYSLAANSPSLAAGSIHNSLHSPSSQLGNGLNSSSGRPAPQYRTSTGPSPRLTSPVGTVRVALANTGSSHLNSNRKRKSIPKHELGSRKPLTLARSVHRRHGRHLTSMPVEKDMKALITGLGSSENSDSDQNSFPPSLQEWPSSNHPSRPSQPSSSVSTYPDYSVKTRHVEKSNKEIFKNGQTAGYIGSTDGGTNWVSTQHELTVGKTNPDMQNHNRGDNEHAVYQAQAESLTSYPLSPQSRERPDLANLNSNSQSSAVSRSSGIQGTSMVDVASRAVHESNSHSPHLPSFPDISASQELAGQASASQSEGGPAVASSRLQQHRTQAENMEQRVTGIPPIQAGERNVQTTRMGRRSDVKDLDPAGDSNKIDSQTVTRHQTALDASEFQGSRMPEKGESNPHDATSQQSLGSSVPQSSGMNVEDAGGIGSSQAYIRDERKEAMDGTSGFTDKENVDSIEPVRKSVRPSVQGLGDPGSNAIGGPSIQVGRNENYQGISNRYMTSTSNEQLSERATSPRFGSTDETVGNEKYQAISSRSTMSASNEQLSEQEASPRFGHVGSRPELMRSLDFSSPGIHNGNGMLDGLCIDNSTHCSCGMVEQTADALEECLFVVDENMSPMLCVTRPCSGKIVCACAPGASTLCQRSVVKSILVRAPTNSLESSEDPTVVACKRETLEDGILVLTPII